MQDYIQQIDDVKKQTEHSIKSFQNSQENRAYVLGKIQFMNVSSNMSHIIIIDQQLKEQQATLILLRHEKDDKEHQSKNLHAELDRINSKFQETLHENNALSVKVQQLEKDRLESEQKLCELRGYADQQRHDAADLNSKNAQLEQLKLQLQKYYIAKLIK